MLLWLIILMSLGTAWLGHKKGFYVMFATLFNLMFAIFVAVLSTRSLLSLSSGYEHSGYYAAAMMVLIFILLFGLLEVLAVLFFFKYQDDFFPKLFDKVGSIIFGFLSGYVVCAFLIMAICVMPFTIEGKMDWLCTRDNMQRLSMPGVRKVCNFLGWYSLHCFEGDGERELGHLMNLDRAAQEELSPESGEVQTPESTESDLEEDIPTE
jgi:hypothetical protein